MHYIALDTNTWIYLANGTEPVKLLQYIDKEVKNGNINIILPDQVAIEWENNKEKNVRQGSLKHFAEIKDALNRLLKLLGDKGERNILSYLLAENDEKDYLKDFILKFEQKRKEIDEAVTENIKLIDNLFSKHAIIVTASEAIYKKAGDFALQKKAPFKTKNSFADALILFSFLDYLTTHGIDEAKFVTYNTDDFCEKKDGKNHLHSDLIPEFENAKSKFYKIVGEALKSIEDDLISKEELALIEEMQEEENWSYDPEFCLVCSDYNYRINEVSFGGPVELIDERVKVIEDKDQLTFDFAKNFVVPKTPETIRTIKVGHCDWCNSEHFICVNCGTLNAVWQHEYNKRKECEGCGLNYVIKVTLDRKGIEEKGVYVIPKDTETCQKCGKEFDIEDITENICYNCEE